MDIETRLKAFAIGLLVLCCALALSFGALQYVVNFANHSSINTNPPLYIYTNATKKEQLVSIEWGSLYPDDIKNFSFCIWNDHTRNNLTLSMLVTDPIPASLWSYSNLSWDQEGTILHPKTYVNTTMSLWIYPNMTGITNFSFNVTISGM